MPESVGTVRLPLVGGTVLSVDMQEEFGLLSLSGGRDWCSASLLRNDWAIAAAHCVERTDAGDQPMPDPSRPGQNQLLPLDKVHVNAVWGPPDARGHHRPQTAVATQIETFRPYDIALIKLATPITVFGSASGYSRLVFQDGQFPYWGETVPLLLTIFGRGISQFATGDGASATRSSAEGAYRVGYAQTTHKEAHETEVWYSGVNGAYIAGGDSGGPSFAWILDGYALVGVHSHANLICVDDHQCGDWDGPGPQPAGYDPWAWVAAAPEACDAPVAPVWDQISTIMGPALPQDEQPPQPLPGYVGVFAKTPPNFQPMWVYGIQDDGVLVWYRKDSIAEQERRGSISKFTMPASTGSDWQGPKQVGSGWGEFTTVIPAGGNRLYALTADGRLLWFQHDGFNDGSLAWKEPVEVGHDWNFAKIFSGGDGVVYAIQDDGTLLWYRHEGFRDGGGIESWAVRTVVGTGWTAFKDVFSTGKGVIYTVRDDGTLLLYKHEGFATGADAWAHPREVGTEWNTFRQVVPASTDGVLLAIRDDGELLWYKDLGAERVSGGPGEVVVDRWREKWEGPVTIDSQWGYKQVFALLPETELPPVR